MIDPRGALERLEELLEGEGGSAAPPSVDALASLAPPAVLGRLLDLHLAARLRRPGGARAAPGVIRAASRAAAAGVVPLVDVVALRRRLESLGRELVEEGLWDPTHPLPWDSPTPSTPDEERFAALDAAAGRALEPARLEAAFGRDPGAPRALVVDRLLPEAWLEAMHRQLAGAPADLLGLEPAGIGADDRLTDRRTDAVRFLSGREPDLLAAVPALAVAVQWFLARLGEILGKALPGLGVHPPQRAMLARYAAPCRGFDAHLDNPGGNADNGRILTVVTYLNPPAEAPVGGEIALWPPRVEGEWDGGVSPEDETTGPARRIVPAAGGAAVLFDSRRVLHRVRPVEEGPDRWVLTVWLNDRPQAPPVLFSVPDPTSTEVLAAIDDPAVPPGRVLFHELDGPGDAPPAPAGRIVSRRLAGAVSEEGARHLSEAGVSHVFQEGARHLPETSDESPREGASHLSGKGARHLLESPTEGAMQGARHLSVEGARHLSEGPATGAAAGGRLGIVATVYGEGERLVEWCRHHVSEGARHLILVFDRPDEAGEARLQERLAGLFGPDLLTLWRASEARRRWASLPDDPTLCGLAGLADGGGASWAVAARQTLNASAALVAARAGEIAGIDWLAQLDGDELLVAEGPARGGATLGEHLGAARAAGLERLRWLNHEVLDAPPGDDGRRRFKINPRLALARLGPGGWRAMVAGLGLDQAGERPWFHGYHNGKGAVAVAAGRCAAGCHGWRLEAEAQGRTDAAVAATRTLAGPVVLHHHFLDPAGFRHKYRAMAAAGEPVEAGGRPFPPAPVEERAVALVRRLEAEGASEGEIDRALDDLREGLTRFDAAEVAMLEEAGLVERFAGFAPGH